MVVPFQGALSFFLGLWSLLPGYFRSFLLFVLVIWLVGVVLHVLISML